MTNTIIIYCVYPDQDMAEKVSRQLLETRLVSCANINPSHRALYWWKDEIWDEQEVAVLYKARKELFERVKEEVLKHHSYDVPCIISWDIADGHQDFVEWIKEETSL